MSPKRTRRRYTAAFKVEVALAALTERQPVVELAFHYQLAPAQISRRKLHLLCLSQPAPTAPKSGWSNASSVIIDNINVLKLRY